MRFWAKFQRYLILFRRFTLRSFGIARFVEQEFEETEMLWKLYLISFRLKIQGPS